MRRDAVEDPQAPGEDREAENGGGEVAGNEARAAQQTSRMRSENQAIGLRRYRGRSDSGTRLVE